MRTTKGGKASLAQENEQLKAPCGEEAISDEVNIDHEADRQTDRTRRERLEITNQRCQRWD